MRILFVGFLVITSCAQVPKHVEEPDTMICDLPVISRAEFKIAGQNFELNDISQRISVANRKEAEQVISNQKIFIQNYYKQSQDPYTGQFHFSKACLEENRFGAIHKSNESVYWAADLYTSAQRQFGYCSGSSEGQRELVVIFYCRDQKEVLVSRQLASALPKIFKLKGSLKCD